jgi:tetratricopeptide (TPR) repeat protein
MSHRPRDLALLLLTVTIFSLGGFGCQKKGHEGDPYRGDPYSAASEGTAKSLLDLTDKPRTRAALDERLARNPGEAKLYVYLAQYDDAAGDHKAALQDIDRAIELDESNRFFFLFLRHFQLDKLGRTQEALASVLEAIRLAPPGYNYQRFAAELERRNGDVEAGVALLDEFVRQHPDDLFLLADRAEFLGKIGRVEDSLRDFATAIEREPHEFHRNMRSLGRIQMLIAKRRFQQALDFANRHIARYPDDPSMLGYGYRARIHEALGHTREAELDMRKWRSLDPH